MTKVAIIGGGLLGVSSAHYLQSAGFDVTVVERNDDVARETSYQNGGLLTPSEPGPWNSPGVHLDLAKYLGKSDAPLLLRMSSIHHYLGWGLKFLANSTRDRHRQSSLANLALSTLSLIELEKLRRKNIVNYQFDTQGTMQLYRNAGELAAAVSTAESMRDLGLRFEVLDGASTSGKEPMLAEIESQIAGSIFYPNDETGDAREYCESLRTTLERLGVEFRFSTTVTGLVSNQSGVHGISTSGGDIDADAVVMAAGAWTPKLLSRYGVHLAIKPVKGYSVSVPLKHGSARPKIGVIDNDMHAAMTPIGNSLRLAGTAEFCGWDDRLDPARVENLFRMLAVLCPGLSAKVDRKTATPWCGFRPMAADGRPYIGETHIKGLFVNAGHGHLGWTQATGSAALLAQVICGETPSLDAKLFSPSR